MLPTENARFIQIKDGRFVAQDTTFFPLMLNYKIEMRYIDEEAIVSPVRYYENPDVHETHEKAAILDQLDKHFALIKELG